MPTLTTIIQHSFGSPSYSSKQKSERKGIQIGKEEVKFSLFADDIILYIENPKDTIRKLLELISEFSKVTGYKINTQKSLAFPYTNNGKSEREIKESIQFTTSTKRIKYLGIKLPKETKELYAENFKTLMKEIKDDINRWRNIFHVSGWEKSILWKWLYYQKQSTDSMQSLSSYHGIFHRDRTKNFIIYGDTKDPEEPKPSWRKRMEQEESTYLILDDTAKLQSSRQHGIRRKTEVYTNGTT